MPENVPPANRYQSIFLDLVLGTLFYAVVIGFFDDYTDFITTKSYSTTFLAALVLQVLTFLTLELESVTAGWFKRRDGVQYRVGMVLAVWLILFLSKFVFLAVIDFTFGDNVEIAGFIDLMVIIITMTIAKLAFDALYARLGALR